jgi:hypothetical protein
MFRRFAEKAAVILAVVLTLVTLWGCFGPRPQPPEFKAMAVSELLTATTYNKTLTVADTEYSQALPAGCKYFTIKGRAAATSVIRWSTITGKVATPTAPYNTIAAGSWFNSPEKYQAASDTIYLASADAGAVVEIVTYSDP